MADIASDIVLLKMVTEPSSFPDYLNLIGDWDITQGYAIKAYVPTSFSLQCSEIDPSSTPVTLSAGWSIIPYLRTSPLDADAAFASIIGDILIVKDEDGNVYVPSLINLIGDLIPGQGYQIKRAPLRR